METNKRTTPIIPNPVLIDRVLGNIQTGLMDNVDWLDVAFGRAQRIAKVIQGKRYYTPNVYAGGTEWRGNNDYIDVSPDANIGNFSFFWIDDPQTVGWIPKEQSEIKAPFSLIVWFDLRKVYPGQLNNRNTEALKNEILTVLNGGFWLKDGKIVINRIYELAENVYRGFTLDEIDNQFLMQPYGGFRFEGMLEVSESCGMVIPSGIVFNPIFEEEGINSYNFTINGKEAVKGNSYPLGSNVVFDIYPVEGKGVENISVNGKVYEGDVIENGKRFVFTLLESPQNIVVNLVNALVEVEASGRAFPIWNTKSGDNKLMSLSIHGRTEQSDTPTPANPVPMRSVGDSGLFLSVMPDKAGSDYQLLNIKDAMKKAGHDGILRSVNGIYDEVVYNGKKWKLIQRIGVLDNIPEMGILFKDATYTDKQLFRFQFKTSEPKNFCATGQILSDIFITATGAAMDKQPLNSCWSIYARENVHYIYFNVPLEYDTVEKAIAYLGENYEIYYPLYTPIEYPLDLPVITTYDEQTYFASNAAEVKPRMIARCKVSKALDYIREGLIGYYTGRGRSNTDENKNILPDLSGNGNDLENKNFAYTVDSGYGDGYIQYDGIDDYSNGKRFENVKCHIHFVCSNYKNNIVQNTIWSGTTTVASESARLYHGGKYMEFFSVNHNDSWLNGDKYTNDNRIGPTDMISAWSTNVYVPAFKLDLCSFGNRFFAKARIYDVLMYDRYLTEEEVQHNYKVSCQYNGEDIDDKAEETTASGDNGFRVYS